MLLLSEIQMILMQMDCRTDSVAGLGYSALSNVVQFCAMWTQSLGLGNYPSLIHWENSGIVYPTNHS